MKLRDLDGFFLKLCPDNSRDIVDALAEADGVMFLCPRCVTANGGKVGTHLVLCWFVGKVPDDLDPKGRWTPSGTGLDDLTFVPGNPARAVSVLLTNPDGCGWHGYIRDGEATLS